MTTTPEPLTVDEVSALATIINFGATTPGLASVAARLVELGALRINVHGRYVSTRLGAAHLLAALCR